MSKFHINKHGVPAPCRATKGNCPLGGEGEHFDTEKAAQAHIDNLNEGTHGLVPELNNNENPYSLSSIREKFPNLTDSEALKLKNYVDEEEKIRDKVVELKKRKDMGSDDYFNDVQKVRQEALSKYELYKDIPINNEELTSLLEENEEEFPQPKPWGRPPGYQFHPELEEKDFWKMSKVMTAYSGKTKEEVKTDVDKIAEEQNLSLHDATKEYWNTLEQRTDKPIVSLDLETANPRHDKSLSYDNGQLTYVIEVGGIKTHPDGRVEKLDVMYGVPQEFEDRHGTGFQETHNITPDDVRGKAEFSSNETEQKKVLDFLDNSVVIAHNAYFEERQLTNSLRGFRGKLNEGNIETLDTMQFCKYMVPESARNTNHAFVEAAGMEYENAHRAYSDAEMTLNAFNNLKDNR